MSRHGARLDAADKQWHLTSPTPYDPPLSYGGWTQGRALGAQIARIIRAREDSLQGDGENSALIDSTSSSTKPLKCHNLKPKKHKIIIHSSPFVRCVQTSIAISAGIAQIYQPRTQKGRLPEPRSEADRLRSEGKTSVQLVNNRPSGQAISIRKPPLPKLSIATLRIDAFLGEWLSPDYYKDITPPPSSVMMVAGAKSDLLRPAEKIAGLDFPSTMKKGNFPGGWRSNWDEPSIDDSSSKSGLNSRAILRRTLPYRSRSHTDSQGDVISSKNHLDNVHLAAANSSNPVTYVPPTPAYALSPSDPIPTGYVAHARDACVEVDYRWDSMRAPYEWGDGGEYGEEWSSMHKRFRTGLQKMIRMYEHPANHLAAEDAPSNEDDENTEIVLILVTHGAGCNALIGALTNQPVLLDVGMASLTMAIRKDGSKKEPALDSSSPIRQRRGSFENALADAYEIKMTASNEHLHIGSTSLVSPSTSPSSHISPVSFPSSRHANGSVSLTNGLNIGEPFTAKAVTNGLHRGPLTTSSLRWALNSSSLKSSSGLWESPRTPASDAGSDSNDDRIPNFGHAGIDTITSEIKDITKLANGSHDESKPMSPRLSQGSPSQQGLWAASTNQNNISDQSDDNLDENDEVPYQIETPKRTFSQRGMWSSRDVTSQDVGPKRRWTTGKEHA